MLSYIGLIQKKFITQYGFKAGKNGCPQNVPDGYYPIKIHGKLDHVRIKDGHIHCCRWDKDEKDDE